MIKLVYIGCVNRLNGGVILEIFTFGKKVGQVINHFDSTFIMTKILNTKAEVRINCMHLAEGGIIGYHKAVVPQLLLVVQGEGCVRGISGESVVTTGDAVFWEKGEGHETISETGMMAIVIEAETLEPAVFMKKK